MQGAAPQGGRPFSLRRRGSHAVGTETRLAGGVRCLLSLLRLVPATVGTLAAPAPPPGLGSILRRCGPFSPDTRYALARIDLNGDGSEAIVYLAGGQWCGSGGCTLLVLSPPGAARAFSSTRW